MYRHLLFLTSLLLSSPVLFAEDTLPEVKPYYHDLTNFKALLKSNANKTWVITGDSITHGAKFLAHSRSYPEILNERIRWELGRRNDMLINTGVSGATVSDLLKHYDFRIGRFKPSFVSINIGMNDASRGEANLPKFRDELTQLVTKVTADGAIVLLQTPNPVVAGNARQISLPPYAQVIRDVAREKGTLLVDHMAEWETLSGTPATAPKHFMGDGIHPNSKGHIQMAHSILLALQIYDPKSQTGKSK